MTDLIQRIEAADEPSGELLNEAAIMLHGLSSAFNWPRFTAMLDAQAWTSAAEMLVPEGWSFSTMRPGSGNMCCAAVWPRPKCDDEQNVWNGYAAHPSLALLSAIMRAERKDDE